VALTSDWFELRAGEQAAGMLVARPWLMAFPALSAVAAGLLLAYGIAVAAGLLGLLALVQALLPLGVARRSTGTGPRSVAVVAGRWLEIRSPTGEVHRWDLLRCRARRSRRHIHVEVTPGRAITVPRRALATPDGWDALGRAVCLTPPGSTNTMGTYVTYRAHDRATRPFDLPVGATIGVLFHQQARTLLPALVLLTVIDVALAQTAALRAMVVVGAAAVGGWSLLAGAAFRVLALSRRDITRGNVVEVRDGGLLHDHPGCSSLRPWRDVTAVRARHGGAAEVRFGRRRTVLPAGAFVDVAHRDAFVRGAAALARQNLLR